MKVKPGDKVKVIYDGFLHSGALFESSESSGPLEFTVGTGLVMPAFEENIIGMQANEKKTFTIPAAQAHGPSQPELIHTMRRSLLPNNKKLKTGMILGLNVDKENKNHKIPAMITALDEKNVTVDFNHPLAGQDLTYKVTLQNIAPSPAAGNAKQP